MIVRRESRLTAVAEVHFRQFDDEGIVLDLANGEYYALNAVGTHVWQGLAAGKSLEEIAVAIAPTYLVDEEVLLRDCVTLAQELVERGFMQLRGDP
jgi:hypothetical protein